MAPATPVFDYCPRGMPVILNETMEAVMRNELATGEVGRATADRATEAYRSEGIRQLRTDPDYREALRAAFEESTVNLVCPTVGRGALNDPVNHEKRVRLGLSRWQARFDELDWMHKATSPDRALEIIEAGDVGVVLNCQNIGVELFEDLSQLDIYHNLGVRVFQLTYNTQNLIGSSSNERVDGGLSNHGVDVVGRLNELDVVIDVTHVGRQTTRDASEVSDAPIAATHLPQAEDEFDTGVFEEKVRDVADSNGYVGLNFMPAYIAPGEQEKAFDIFFERMAYLVDLIGIDNVGIGSDWGRWTAEQPEALQKHLQAGYEAKGSNTSAGSTFGPMERYADWHLVREGLTEHGFTEEEAVKIAGQNFLDFWQRVVR